MGPRIILDKSAFQALSRPEMGLLSKHFMENLTPILGLEILGNLSKYPKKRPDEIPKIQHLAFKFGGSGGVVCAEYEYLCLANLLGGTVPMNGQIPVSHGTTYQVEGGYGLYVDLAPINKAILRWSEGKFSQAERYFSKRWNEVINSVTLEAFENELESRRIITPSVNNLEDLGDAADDVLKTLALQHVFLKWMLKRLSIERELRNEIMARWSARKSPYLEDFAPYVFFCLRALLMLHLAVRNELVRWDSKNIVDLVYLFYAPFCDVFASDDKLHRRLAPHVLRDDQSFVRGSDLKKDLSRMIDEMEKSQMMSKGELASRLDHIHYLQQNL